MEKINGKFNEACAPCAPRIKERLLSISDEIKKETFEIRLRAEGALILCGTYGCGFINSDGRFSLIYPKSPLVVTKQEIDATLSRMCSFSMHTYQQNLVDGYITLSGGHRVGICGTAVNEKSIIMSVREISSLNIRIAREVYGVSRKILDEVFYEHVSSLIIAGPPSSGKTTLIRDIARELSGGFGCCYRKVVIADERGEIAAVKDGIPQNDIGLNSDVICGFPKGTAIMNALKSMSPEVIICDEVGTKDEIEAIEYGLNSGVKFILTVHASSCEELKRKKQIKMLLETGEFNNIVLLKSGRVPGVIEKIINCEVLLNEICRSNTFRSFSSDDWTNFSTETEKTYKAVDRDTAVYFRR